MEELFLKYLDERISPDELRLFRELATREENRAELNRLLAQWIDRDLSSRQPEEIDIETLYLELTQREQIPAVTISPVFSLRRIVLLSTAVAAACLLVVSGIFLLRRPPAAQPVRLVARSAVISPASNKAILTLANGTQIVLDSAVNGKLATQGNMQVVKLAGGQLAYEAGGNSAATEQLYNEVSTPRGGYYQLILPDGSKVWLNAASSVRYPIAFTGKERSVELSGEAYFEIVPNASQPFSITDNGVTVQVLGTAFNMMAYPDEDAIRTTLVSGSVRVRHGDDYQKLRPGEQASWAQGGSKWQLSLPDLQEVLAWKQGEFRFQGMKIAAIMRQIARWYDVDVEFRGPQPVNAFSGVIPRKKDVDELLTVLEQTDDVHFTLQGRKIIVESVVH